MAFFVSVALLGGGCFVRFGFRPLHYENGPVLSDIKCLQNVFLIDRIGV
jgi:hypothetical protein